MGEIVGYGIQGVARGLGRGTDFNIGNPCRANSFSADTLISTPDGDVEIADIEIGDTVYAYNEETGEVEEQEVLFVFIHDDDAIVTLTIDGEVIETTPWHPFYTDEGWVDAEDLQPGDLVLALDGDYGTVEATFTEARTQTMYDLDMAIVDTFAVGDGAWVVHNCDIDLSGFKDFDTQYRNDIRLLSNDTSINSANLDMLVLTRYLREQAGQLDGYTGFTGRISTFGSARTSSGSTIFTVQNSGPRTGGLISAFGLNESSDLSKVLTIPDYGNIEFVNPLLIPKNQIPNWVKQVNGQIEDAAINVHAEGNLIGFTGAKNITTIAISHYSGMCQRCEDMMNQRFSSIAVYYSTWKRR